MLTRFTTHDQKELIMKSFLKLTYMELKLHSPLKKSAAVRLPTIHRQSSRSKTPLLGRGIASHWHSEEFFNGQGGYENVAADLKRCDRRPWLRSSTPSSQVHPRQVHR